MKTYIYIYTFLKKKPYVYSNENIITLEKFKYRDI